MADSFTHIAFTPSVRAAQMRYGSREASRAGDADADTSKALTALETRFIAERDSFYQATVSETGWPYVQHRGGPIGFLKVLDQRTIAYADFRGNVQYLSVGNLTANDRISLILVDYARRKRLKLWGRARIVHPGDDSGLMARLEVAPYRARIERGIVVKIEAYAWNCSRHITPRFTQAEAEHLLAPPVERHGSISSSKSN